MPHYRAFRLFTFNYLAIDYIKWDMNREVVQPAHNGHAAGHQQVVRYYQLVDKIRTAHPKVDIESCAAGGGRIDFEVLNFNKAALYSLAVIPPETLFSKAIVLLSNFTKLMW